MPLRGQFHFPSQQSGVNKPTLPASTPSSQPVTEMDGCFIFYGEGGSGGDASWVRFSFVSRKLPSLEKTGR